jgi:uncharacterized protein (DUF1501 family)
MTLPALTRRSLAAAGFALPLLAHPAMAAASDRRFVVAICRGGMDGLSLAPPLGDPAYAGLRGALAVTEGARRLDGDFALHPALARTHALFQAGQARLAPAVASPDRARSHFEAQDVLETGAPGVYATTSGWLNRAVQAIGGTPSGPGAISIGPTAPLILRGAAPAGSWSPGPGLDESSRLPALLGDLYRNDPLLGPALARGLATEALARETGVSGMQVQMAGAGPNQPGGQASRAGLAVGQALAGFLVAPDGPRIAAVSLDGWDTHAGQAGQIAGRLAGLDAFIGALRDGLGPAWSSTVVLVATEFGRTARVNGTNGTDHGTASAALVLGGGLKPGGLIGDWPTLREAALYEGRDLAPTVDLRALAKGLLAEHLGLPRNVLDRLVFPESGRVAAVTSLV